MPPTDDRRILVFLEIPGTDLCVYDGPFRLNMRSRHHILCSILLEFIVSWRRSIVVRTLVSAGELSLSCAGLLAGWVTTLWLSRPLSVGQYGQLSHPSLRGR